MQYLNLPSLEQTSSDTFQGQHPYPWVNLQSSLTPEGFECLRTSLPDASTPGIRKFESVKRRYGQAPHDRYILYFRPGMALAQPWKKFVAELQGETYLTFLRRMLGTRKPLTLTMEWYYAWQGCAVSPHCDALRKLATHIFYFNTEDDWDPAWGGQILILDDERRLDANSAPDFDDLGVAASIEPLGNASLLFQRTPHSWHGVRALQCPPHTLRKLFIVTVNISRFPVWWRSALGVGPHGYTFTA